MFKVNIFHRNTDFSHRNIYNDEIKVVSADQGCDIGVSNHHSSRQVESNFSLKLQYSVDGESKMATINKSVLIYLMHVNENAHA